MTRVTGREQGQVGGVGGAAAVDAGPAIGKQTRVEAAMVPAPAATALAGPAALAGGAGASEADRVADLVNRGAATDPEPSAPQTFPAPAGATPSQRHAAAAARLQLIESSIGFEDATAGRGPGQTKDDSQPGRETVAHQLVATGTRKAALSAQTRSTQAKTGRDAAAAQAAAAAFEAAVRAYQDAYERTYLVSTDAPVQPKAKAWEATPQRDRLGSPTVNAKLVAWAAAATFVKFVIPASKPTEVYVGHPDLGHIEIANDTALAAGLLRIRSEPLRVSEVENASGGYRPGPLRNALVLARMIDLGYVQDDLRGTQVDHRADGSYTGSKIDPH